MAATKVEKKKAVEPIIITDPDASKEYTLEFNRKSIAKTERAGFDINEIDSKPMTMIPLFFWGAFQWHHPNMTTVQTDKILFEEFGGPMAMMKITNEDGESIVERLAKLYNLPFGALADDEEEEGKTEGNPLRMTVKF